MKSQATQGRDLQNYVPLKGFRMLGFLQHIYLPGVLLLAICSGFLFGLKHKVQILAHDLKELNAQILNEKELIHLLNAELTYLSSPKRIQKLADEHLSMQLIKKDQVLSEIALSNLLKRQESPVITNPFEVLPQEVEQ
jgi:cell division protein FtsL